MDSKSPTATLNDGHAEILARAVMYSPASVAVTDTEGRIEYVNRTFCELTGYEQHEAIGQNASLLKAGDMPEECYAELWQKLAKGEDWIGVFHNRRKNGETYWERATISPVRNTSGNIHHFLKIAEDITRQRQLEEELKASYEALKESEARLKETCEQLKATTRALRSSERRLKRLSREDALTGLLNRRGLEEELVRFLALSEREGYGIGMLVLDIDFFKRINDEHGHAVGDRILKEVARMLKTCLRASDIVCRYGGDEIVIALPMADAETTRCTAERVLEKVRQHQFLRAKKMSVTVSIGAACGKPVPGCTLAEVMRRADEALYQVKRNGRNGMSLWACHLA